MESETLKKANALVKSIDSLDIRIARLDKMAAMPGVYLSHPNITSETIPEKYRLTFIALMKADLLQARANLLEELVAL